MPKMNSQCFWPPAKNVWGQSASCQTMRRPHDLQHLPLLRTRNQKRNNTAVSSVMSSQTLADNKTSRSQLLYERYFFSGTENDWPDVHLRCARKTFRTAQRSKDTDRRRGR